VELSDWDRQIALFVHEIADAKYQEEVWLGKKKTLQSSFTEAVCGLYDDFMFDLYVEELKNRNIDRQNLSHIENFKASLDDFLSSVNTINVSDKAIIGHAKWREVREYAFNAAYVLDVIAGEA